MDSGSREDGRGRGNSISMRSPPRTVYEGRAGRPRTRTCPARIRRCKEARLSPGRRAARVRSRRSPRELAGSSSLRGLPASLDRGRPVIASGASPRGGYVASGTAETVQHEGGHERGRNRDQLRCGQGAAEENPARSVAPEDFDHEAQDRVEEDVDPEHLTREASSRQNEERDRQDQEFWVYVLLYAVLRFVVEIFRGDAPRG